MCGPCAGQCCLAFVVRDPCLYASHDSLRPPLSLVAPDAQLSLSIPSLISSSLPFFPFCLIPFLSISFTFFSQLPLFCFFVCFFTLLTFYHRRLVLRDLHFLNLTSPWSPPSPFPPPSLPCP